MDLTTLSETALKALAYEQIKILHQTQHNIAVLEQEMAKRVATPAAPTHEGE